MNNIYNNIASTTYFKLLHSEKSDLPLIVNKLRQIGVTFLRVVNYFFGTHQWENNNALANRLIIHLTDNPTDDQFPEMQKIYSLMSSHHLNKDLKEQLNQLLFPPPKLERQMSLAISDIGKAKLKVLLPPSKFSLLQFFSSSISSNLSRSVQVNKILKFFANVSLINTLLFSKMAEIKKISSNTFSLQLNHQNSINPLSKHNNTTKSLEFVGNIQVSFDSLPQELILEIFALLGAVELARCASVNRKWQILANSEKLLPHGTFGHNDWITYFGDVGKRPHLSLKIHEILNRPCPIWPDKKIKDTHLLFLVPKTIDEKSLTLNTLGEFVQTPKIGYQTSYKGGYGRDETFFDTCGNCSSSEAHWILITKNFLPESIEKHYQTCKRLLEKLAVKSHLSYEMPLPLDTVVGLFMSYIKNGKYLLSTMAYTYCQEYKDAPVLPPIKDGGYPTRVIEIGSFNESGLSCRIFANNPSWWSGVLGCIDVTHL